MKSTDLKHGEVYRLSRYVMNVKRDRRKSDKTLPGAIGWAEGTLVCVRDLLSQQFGGRSKAVVGKTLHLKGFYDWIGQNEVNFDALVDAMEPATTNLDSVLFKARSGMNMTSAKDLLEELVASGEVTLDRLSQIADGLEKAELARIAEKTPES